MMEFHIARTARETYQLETGLFGIRGNVIFANFQAARTLAQKMNARRNLTAAPETAVRASHLNALGLLDEIIHRVLESYRMQKNPAVLEQAMSWLEDDLGAAKLQVCLRQFAADFPTVAVYQQQMDVEQYLNGETDGMPNQQVVLEEMLLLWLDNANPAAARLRELFDDSNLETQTGYRQVIQSLRNFFDDQPGFGPDQENLIDMLRRPALESPDSLSGQLEFIRKHWGTLIGDLVYRLLNSLDFIKEEEKPVFGVGGAGPAKVLEFSGADYEFEAENFSPDKDWMPRLILLAKNAYVWLDQLSKKYRRPIRTLNQVPDEELRTLARWGITGLWLIGLWERSQASQRIKQMRGNPDAVASAYSLYDYQIAASLGGDAAFQDLRSRAWQVGIRMSADMVPNHVGIDARWVIEHPDWFVALDYSPFPTYTFNGPNLSGDERVGIYLEDHYYDNSDAAVVFKRVDFWTGSVKYIYHGNDGTSMPWNDTAQLNYLLPEVREAVIQTILHVARNFPVIRFDAAMTLAKKHYQRLWFPEPGTGGDIPSRAEFGMTRSQFDAAIPQEFWREVVDRVAQEAPDTLLLAEAFWLMEGYFVRTLGMHRVYNSAFMNMTRDEKNAEYRLVIKNTLEFDPEILKRYVNFMNNPDERTAVDQYGKGDKYFGVCTMMITMPGLPMIGHGQIEGYSEKYGMEYQRAYWDEYPDQGLIEGHERLIFPLLRRRSLFAEVENFLLYDFFTPEGYVDENVFAYSNLQGNERSLVIYHNRYNSTRGWIKTSAAYAVKTGEGDQKRLVQRSIQEGLGLSNEPQVYTIFKDHVSGLEFIRNNRELTEQGLYVELEAYKCHVFLDFRQVVDSEWSPYARLVASLQGRGVPDVEEALHELILQPLLEPFRELVNPVMFRWIISHRVQRTEPDGTLFEDVLTEIKLKSLRWLEEARQLAGGKLDENPIATETQQIASSVLRLPVLDQLYSAPDDPIYQEALAYLGIGADRTTPGGQLMAGDVTIWGTLLGWLFTHLGGKCVQEDYAELSRTWLDEWLLGKSVRNTLVGLDIEPYQADQKQGLLRALVAHHNWWRESQLQKGKKGKNTALVELARSWLNDDAVQTFIGMNRYEGVMYFNKEAFEELVWWLYTTALILITYTPAGAKPKKAAVIKEIKACYQTIRKLLEAEAASEYQIEKLLEALRQV